RSRERELAEVAAELGAGDAWTVEDHRGWGRGALAYADRAGGQDPPARASAPLLQGHVLPGAAAGALPARALRTLGDGPPPVTPLLAGALVAAIVGLLPRIGWIATATV